MPLPVAGSPLGPKAPWITPLYLFPGLRIGHIQLLHDLNLLLLGPLVRRSRGHLSVGECVRGVGSEGQLVVEGGLGLEGRALSNEEMAVVEDLLLLHVEDLLPYVERHGAVGPPDYL